MGSKIYFVTASKSSDVPPLTSVLWISDGTAKGTVKDVSLTTNAILKLDPSQTAVAGGRLYFLPNVTPTGSELWISDGSPATHVVPRINPITTGSDPRQFTAGVGGVYFGASTGIYLLNESTHKLSQLVPFTTHEFLDDYVSFIGKLGTAEIIVGYHAIWRSDGTKAGTKQIFTTDRYISDAAIAGCSLPNNFSKIGSARRSKVIALSYSPLLL